MAGERNYMRVPPDSSGKRVRLEHSAQIFYSNKSSGYTWATNKIYRLGAGWFFTLGEVYEETATTGVLTVRYENDAVYGNLAPVTGDSVNDIIVDPELGQTVARVETVQDVWTNSGNIVSYNNPKQGLLVDNLGAARVRLAEGNLALDAWGKLRVTGATPLAEYVFSDPSILSLGFSSKTTTGGSVTFDASNKLVSIASDSTPNSVAMLSSNLYHHYVPGSGHLFACTALANDPSAIGAERHWGLIDEYNGLAFTINDQGEFGVTIRSSASGSVVDTFIPQVSFNKDKVNGAKTDENPSDMNLVLSNNNLYWLDVQWHGAGRARFGTYYNGQRVVMHEFYQGNNFQTAMSQTVSLPVSCIVKNINSASPLLIKTWSASVWTETDININRLGSNASFSADIQTITAGPTDQFQPVFAFAPQKTLSSGDENHTTYMPSSVNAVAFDSTTGEERLVELGIAAEPTFSTPSWTSVHPANTVDVTQNLSTYDNGVFAFNRVFRGQINADLFDTFNNFQYGSIKNYALQGGTVVNNVAFVSQAATAEVTFLERLNIREDSGLVTFSNVSGMTELNGNSYYAKVTGVNSVELYQDQARTVPLDTTGFSAYTGDGIVSGDRGLRQVWVVFVRKLVATADCDIKISIAWKEVKQ